MSGLEDPGAKLPLGDYSEGAPDWMSGTLRYCARCGGPLTYELVPEEHRKRHRCTTCGCITYVNPRLVVTTLPVTADDELILIRRAIEPGRGRWAQPGGFLEADETVLQGAVRETLEETGLLVEPAHIVGVYSHPRATVVTIVYQAAIVGGSMVATAEALEVRPFAAADIPWRDLAFSTTRWAVRDWVRSVRPDLDVDGLAADEQDAPR